MRSNPAVVLGMFETGLAVGRSLGRSGINVRGLDVSSKVGFHSKYIDASLCPHPLDREEEFVDFLVRLAKNQDTQPVLFVTADEFLLAVARNKQELAEHYLMNISNPEIIDCIADKSKQSQLALDAGISVPQTFLVQNMDQLVRVVDRIPLPAFIKGNEVTSWRRKMEGNFKGFVAASREELITTCRWIFERGTHGLVQEIIPGPDTSHFKASCYISRDGRVLLAFGLQKLRQHPVGFGFGCLVQSVEYPELLSLGTRLLTRIGYRGVGSAEFKLDDRDGTLKLIEINARYWQQNSLADRCGMNFPMLDYLEVIGAEPPAVREYRHGIKWVNIYSDLESFRQYRARGTYSVKDWINSLRGEKIYSDLDKDDLLPGLRELVVEHIFRRLGRYIRKRMKRGSAQREGPPRRD